jgi:hypothetical protein
MILYSNISFQFQRRIISTTLRCNSPYFVISKPTRTYTSASIQLDAKMSSLYNQSIPVMIKYLHNISKILDKTVAYADEKGLKHDEILSFRLREDMRPSVISLELHSVVLCPHSQANICSSALVFLTRSSQCPTRQNSSVPASYCFLRST